MVVGKGQRNLLTRNLVDSISGNELKAGARLEDRGGSMMHDPPCWR